MFKEEKTSEKSKEINFCPTCNSVVETAIIYSYVSENTVNEDLCGYITEVFLSQCLRCKNPFLKEKNFQIAGGDDFLTSELQFFPNTENEAIKNCPKIVFNPYKEALKCYRAHAYDACVIMCRKGIEAICIDKGENKGDLANKLKSLNSKGVLENTLYNWANELRLIGNDGAHSHNQIVNQQDAKEAVDFFDALITYLYHLVNQYEKLIKRRKK
ncbi:DUF4145 domain-containing protein [Tenacibaculum aestuarii]|uniref:DUF4145 domain-containing protein n=1 Tax=Tenacibaculum aestuarii TaxID=362781 RepID=UPI003894D6C4